MQRHREGGSIKSESNKVAGICCCPTLLRIARSLQEIGNRFLMTLLGQGQIGGKGEGRNSSQNGLRSGQKIPQGGSPGLEFIGLLLVFIYK